MCRAIQASDNDAVQLLWQCGRSVTLTCVSGGDKTYLLQRSLMASEDYQTASELTDTWSHWAAKVNQLLSTFSSKKPADQEKFLKTRDISFRGAQASRALVNGIVAMRRFSADCLEALKMIDKEFGVAVFNSGYVKLVMEDAILWVLHAAYVALKREQAQPSFFTSKNLDGSKDAGGWFHVTLSKYLLLEHMIHVVETLQVESSKDLLAALQAIRRPLLFHSLYPVDAEEDHGPQLAGASKRWYGIALALYLNEYDESLIKMSKLLGCSGNSSADARSFVKQVSRLKKAGVTEILYDGESSFKDLDLHQEWTAALAELGKVSEIVQVSDTGAPKMTVRTLARMSSDPDADLATQRERDEIWRQAQALRKKVVNLAFGRTEADLNALWNKPVAEEVKSFAGELNESHRLWVLSTELLEEKQMTPWSAIGSLTDKGDAKNLLKFIQNNATKPFDFVLVWDGRSLANRKFLDEELKVLQNASTTTELWITYKGTSRVGRRVFGGSVTKEIGYLKSNVARDKFVDKNGSDEISTYDTGFVGVDLPVLTTLPRMLEAEKEQILGKNNSGAKPAAWSRAGVPLFWQEAKTESCWEAIIGLTSAKCIIDATAGSGALAKVAMRSNLQYLGICKNKSHMNFLQNVIDMHAIRCLSQSSHPLYQQSLSELLCEHFHEEVKGQKDSSDPLTPEEVLALQGENEVNHLAAGSLAVANGPLSVSSVSGYAVRPVTADLPDIGEVTAYVVDEEAEQVDDVPDWVPAEWLSPVMGDSDVSDVYGAIGVWPAAFVAAEEVMKYASATLGEWSCLELGCGAGFPSLVAAKSGAASVYALDTEQLTLDLLQAAFDQQGQGRLIPLLGDAEDLPQEPLSSVPLVVVSDLLCSVQLGRALGETLAKWLKGQKERKLILTDGGRSGRLAFLEAFSEAHGSQAYFEDSPVPFWAPQKGDFFDGSETASVGLLRY
eukprot:s794_g2.t1